jgi:hypothetical protein
LKEREFISFWLQNIQQDGLKEFPQDFISSKNNTSVSLPGKALVLGKEFFGNYEILTVDGSVYLQAKSIHHAKYIIYANRNFPKEIKMPAEENEMSASVSAYENYIDSLIRLIATDYKKKFPGEKNQQTIINNILRTLNLIRY